MTFENIVTQFLDPKKCYFRHWNDVFVFVFIVKEKDKIGLGMGQIWNTQIV